MGGWEIRPRHLWSWKACRSKKRFVTRSFARKARNLAELKYKSRLEVYKCDDCHGFHLATKMGFK